MYNLSEKEMIYMKEVYRGGVQGVRLSMLATALGISPPSALEEVRHLQKKALLKNEGGRITISKNGMKVLEALRITHIAFETAFVRLGMPVEDVCAAVHVFDFKVPQELGLKIYRAVGKPAKCPNGKFSC